MRKGSHHSEDTLRKMRAKANREPRPEYVKEQISLTKQLSYHPYRGKELSEEHRKNISDGMKKRKQKEREEKDAAENYQYAA